jgi:hypothetical protein
MNITVTNALFRSWIDDKYLPQATHQEQQIPAKAKTEAITLFGGFKGMGENPSMKNRKTRLDTKYRI